jgi:hypothetical protein
MAGVRQMRVRFWKSCESRLFGNSGTKGMIVSPPKPLIEQSRWYKKKDGNADERKWPQMNANGAEQLAVAVRPSQVQEDASELQARRPKFHQQAEMLCRRKYSPTMISL